MDLAIETNNLTKCYGKVRVLDRLNLRVPKGRIHGLVGPNGAGKTSTLKILCGISKPTSGSARIMGFDVETQPYEAKKLIGFIPENPALYKSLTVGEILEFVGDIYLVPEKVRESRVEKFTSMFEIQSAENKFIGSLSKGELQRVMICSLMIREPSVFLLDEPFYALDPKGAVTLREVLKDRCESGAAVLLATHLLDVAEKLCDTFTIIDNGRTVANGHLREFRKRVGHNSSLEEAFLYFTEGRGPRN